MKSQEQNLETTRYDVETLENRLSLSATVDVAGLVHVEVPLDLSVEVLPPVVDVDLVI